MHSEIAAAATLAVAVLCASEAAMGQSRHETLVADYYSKFMQPGFTVDQLMAYYDDDVKFSDPTFGIIANGKDEVRKLYADTGTDRTSYRKLNWTLSNIIAANGSVAINGRWAGDFSNCPFDVEFVTLWRFKNDLIIEQKDFFAAGEFDRQVGWDAALGRPTCATADHSDRQGS